jgi:hypothetical protein
MQEVDGRGGGAHGRGKKGIDRGAGANDEGALPNNRRSAATGAGKR